MKDGLPNNQFNYNSAIKANDGLFYFGSIGGVIAFNPEKRTIRLCSHHYISPD